MDTLNAYYSDFGTFEYDYALNKIIFTSKNCVPHQIYLNVVCER